MDEETEERKSSKKSMVENTESLKIPYEEDELNEFFPHLIEEISKKEKSIKIDSVTTSIENDIEEKLQRSDLIHPKELINPGPIDFIRRCSTSEEAFTIMEFLLARGEITPKEFTLLKNQIKTDNGLKKLIEKYGGFKRPGYYERKFRSSFQKKNEKP